ncbi:unnamed protein product [Eruca vesicaria subsp. sativa]|uniref:Uncharacterized protein n=1 Tax=Eruca vesicaria subsp. sativa TaxID=29727 RepID=A0ABC8LVZ4_ERUVS|nr:unnamed protein product [Eruca vesicaria subsp. sativa]
MTHPYEEYMRMKELKAYNDMLSLHFCQLWVFAIKDEVKKILNHVAEMKSEICELKSELHRVRHEGSSSTY